MNKKFIVENLEFDKKFKNEKEIEDLNFKRDNAIGIWAVSYTHLTLPTILRV